MSVQIRLPFRTSSRSIGIKELVDAEMRINMRKAALYKSVRKVKDVEVEMANGRKLRGTVLAISKKSDNYKVLLRNGVVKMFGWDKVHVKKRNK